MIRWYPTFYIQLILSCTCTQRYSTCTVLFVVQEERLLKGEADMKSRIEQEYRAKAEAEARAKIEAEMRARGEDHLIPNGGSARGPLSPAGSSNETEASLSVPSIEWGEGKYSSSNHDGPPFSEGRMLDVSEAEEMNAAIRQLYLSTPVGGGSPFVLFKAMLRTSKRQWYIERRYSDFVWLHEVREERGEGGGACLTVDDLCFFFWGGGGGKGSSLVGIEYFRALELS